MLLRISILAAVLAAFTTVPAVAMARPAVNASANVELLNGTVRSVGHSARGRAAVVKLSSGGRRLTLRNFAIDPGPRVRVWLVPKGVSGDSRVDDDYKDLGALKGSRGNQEYRIPGSIDLRKYQSVIFWCVPFTQTLARADLKRS